MPLLKFSVQDAAKHIRFDVNIDNSEDRPKLKPWYTYAPLALAVFLILIPQFPYFIMLSSFYFVTTHSTSKFIIHSVLVVTLTLLSLTYLIICSTRDPGFIRPLRDRERPGSTTTTQSESEQALLEADRAAEEATSENVSEPEIERLVILGKWCRKCYMRRPERAHHCSTCGRCVLKMDHHCPWLGGNCVGFRNYPSFVCFVSTAMLLSTYMSAVAIGVVVRLVRDPFTADPDTSPLHALFIALSGAVFALSLGSFTFYHFYLIWTNQTTFEHLSPFHILRYVPPPKPHVPPLPSAVSSRPNLKIASEFTVPSRSSRSLDSPLSFDESDPIQPFHNENDQNNIGLQRLESNISDIGISSELISHPSLPVPSYKPPEEHELSSAQRRFVLRMHGKIHMYNLGWKRNWKEVFGGGLAESEDERNDDDASLRKNGRKLRWLKLLLIGGRQKGTGWKFEKTPNLDAKLQRFAKILREITEEESR